MEALYIVWGGGIFSSMGGGIFSSMGRRYIQ